MRLFELDVQNALATKIIAATDQLRADLENGKIQPDWTVDKLLKYFEDFDIILDPTDLYNMVKQEPLKNVVTNIQGDQVVFKGQASKSTPAEVPQDQSQEVVAQMAKSAMPT